MLEDILSAIILVLVFISPIMIIVALVDDKETDDKEVDDKDR